MVLMRHCQIELVEQTEKRAHKKRISLGLAVDDRRQSVDVFRRRLQRVRQKLPHVAFGDIFYLERRNRNGVAPQIINCGRQRVAGINFVVAIGNDDQEVAQFTTNLQLLEQFQRRGVGPLPVVDEEHQGMLGPAEHFE